MTSERSLSRPGILAAALLLVPLLSSLAPPRAGAEEVNWWELPKIEVKAGPPVTEGEPMTFTLRVTPVQAVDLVVPVLIEDGRGFEHHANTLAEFGRIGKGWIMEGETADFTIRVGDTEVMREDIDICFNVVDNYRGTGDMAGWPENPSSP